MSTNAIIESLSMDLLRVALGLHRGSKNMVQRFKQEALDRQRELRLQKLHNTYLDKLLDGLSSVLNTEGKGIEDDLLMYSILFQNFARHYIIS